MMLPFEFTLKGPPVSQQTKKRARLRAWKQQVQNAARPRLPEGAVPTSGDVKVTITYYYEGESPDVDNIIKPIQDALAGLVFVDDSQVVETKGRKRSINGSYRIRGASPTLLLAFADGDNFLHVEIAEAIETEGLD